MHINAKNGIIWINLEGNMKRNFFIILTILLIISAIVGCTVYNYRRTQANIAQYNKQ